MPMFRHTGICQFRPNLPQKKKKNPIKAWRDEITVFLDITERALPQNEPEDDNVLNAYSRAISLLSPAK